MKLINEDLNHRILKDNDNEIIKKVPNKNIKKLYKSLYYNDDYGTNNDDTIPNKNVDYLQYNKNKNIINNTKQNECYSTSSTIDTANNNKDKFKSSVKCSNSFLKKLLKTSKDNITIGCDKIVNNISPNLLRKKLLINNNHQEKPIPPIRKKKLLNHSKFNENNKEYNNEKKLLTSTSACTLCVDNKLEKNYISNNNYPENKLYSSKKNISIEDIDNFDTTECNYKYHGKSKYPRKRSKSLISKNNINYNENYKNKFEKASTTSLTFKNDNSLSNDLYIKWSSDNLVSRLNTQKLLSTRSYENIDEKYNNNYYNINSYVLKKHNSVEIKNLTNKKTDLTTPLYLSVKNKADNTKTQLTSEHKRIKFPNNKFKNYNYLYNNNYDEKKKIKEGIIKFYDDTKVINIKNIYKKEKLDHLSSDNISDNTFNKDKIISCLLIDKIHDNKLLKSTSESVGPLNDSILKLRSNKPIDLSNNNTNNNSTSVLNNKINEKLNMKPFLRMIRIKEKIIFAFSAFAILFTVLLVMDLQMDLGYSGHHLVPSHGRVKMNDDQYRDTVYNNFRRRFKYRANTSKEILSTNFISSSTQNNNNKNELSDSDNNKGDNNDKEKLHDEFFDLVNVVMNDDGIDTDSGVVRNSGEDYNDNLSVGEMLGITER